MPVFFASRHLLLKWSDRAKSAGNDHRQSAPPLRLVNARRLNHFLELSEFFNGGRSWIRTSEGVSQQIYSLPPLATWVSYHSPTSLQGRGFKPKPVAPLKRKVLFFKCQPLRRPSSNFEL